jgi:hypothetical protein
VRPVTRRTIRLFDSAGVVIRTHLAVTNAMPDLLVTDDGVFVRLTQDAMVRYDRPVSALMSLERRPV